MVAGSIAFPYWGEAGAQLQLCAVPGQMLFPPWPPLGVVLSQDPSLPSLSFGKLVVQLWGQTCV